MANIGNFHYDAQVLSWCGGKQHILMSGLSGIILYYYHQNTTAPPKDHLPKTLLAKRSRCAEGLGDGARFIHLCGQIDRRAVCVTGVGMVTVQNPEHINYFYGGRYRA